jgi:hypothetical protein
LNPNARIRATGTGLPGQAGLPEPELHPLVIASTCAGYGVSLYRRATASERSSGYLDGGYDATAAAEDGEETLVEQGKITS